MILRLVVYWDPHRTSANQRLHWRERMRRNRMAKERAGLAWLQAGRPVARGPVRLSVLVRRVRRMDPDNVWSGLKPVIDGLFKRRFTPDDSGEFVTLGTVEFETGQAWARRPEVVLTLEAADFAPEAPPVLRRAG